MKIRRTVFEFQAGEVLRLSDLVSHFEEEYRKLNAPFEGQYDYLVKRGDRLKPTKLEVMLYMARPHDAISPPDLPGFASDALKQIQRYRLTQKGVYEMIEEIPFSDTKGDYLIASGGIPLAEIEVKPSEMMWTSLPTIFRFPQGEEGETFSHVPDFMASPRQVTLELGGPSKGRTPFKQMYARAIEYYKKRCLSTVSQE